MWLLSVPVSPGQAQASDFCLPSFVSGVAQSPIYWGASWVYLVSPLSTPNWSLPGGGGTCTVNQVFTFTMTSLAPIMYFTFALFILQ